MRPDLKKMKSIDDLVDKDQASSGSDVLDALNSRYCCLSEPLASASRPNSDDGSSRYLTRLMVFGNKEVDDDEPLPSSFSKLLDDHNIINPKKIEGKITHALSNMSFRDPRVLVQFWLPSIVRKRCFLTSLDQPFGLGVVDEDLYSYRLESEQRIFVVDGEHREELGPPGRVYRLKLPEWSLNAHILPTRQCSNGYINLPVFEPDNDCCVGVLEIITSSNHVDYTFEVQEVSRALKEENLKCPNLFEEYGFYTQVGDERRQNELDEIFVALKSICDTLDIPLAQTWALCGHSSVVANSGNLEQSCSSFNRKCIGKVCMSTYGLPVYVRDQRMWGFHDACRERHLDKSHGVVGRSLSSCGICFCEDVTKLGEDEYPLGSYARDNGITSCLAIYLKSIERDVEYVIELVLPPDNTNEADLQSLVKTLKLHFKSVSSLELGNMSSLLVIGGDPRDWNLESSPSPLTLLTEEEVLKEPGNHQLLVENEVTDVVDVTVLKDPSVVAHVELMEDDNLEIERMDNAAAGTSLSVVPFLDVGIEDVDSNKGKKGRNILKDEYKKPSKKRKTSEISFTLEQISKHYEMPIKEAAVKLDVSRKRLQEICRGLGILRWPYKNHKSDSLLKSNQTDAVIHTSEGGPTPVLGASCEPVQLNGSAQPETTIRVQNTSAANTLDNLKIRVTYENTTIKFPFRLTDGLAKLQELVARWFQLSARSFILKYEDEDGDMILLACDSDLMAVSISRQSDGQTVIRLFVSPVASPDEY